MLRKWLVVSCLYICSFISNGQSTFEFPDKSSIISYNAGISFTGNIDKSISGSKYEATHYSHSLAWDKYYQKGILHLKLNHLNTSDLSYNSRNADLLQFSLITDYSFLVSNYKLFNRNGAFYFGPIFDIYYYKRTQNIYTLNNLNEFESDIGILALGLNIRFMLNLTDKIYMDAASGLDLATMFLKSGENNDATFVTPLDLKKSYTDIHVRYKMNPHMMISIGYEFQFLNNEKYDELAIASDCLMLTFSLIL